jgi:hypothetical protein
MNIYNLKNNMLSQVNEMPFLLEKDIQSLVESNIYDLFGYSFVSSEFSVSEYRLDSLCFDEENNSFVIVEYKKGSSYSVIDQGYSYLSTMLNNKAEFILEYNERQNATLKRDEVNWSSSKVLFVSPSFNSYQKNSVNFKDVPFELWEIKRFEGNILCLEQHKATSKESIEKVTGDTLIKSVSKEVKPNLEEDVILKSDTKTQQKWFELKEKLLNFENTEMVVGKGYIKFTKNGKGVCYFNFRKNFFNGEIIRGNIKVDGSKSKGFFIIDDPKNIVRERDFEWKSGDKGCRYIFDIKSDIDLDYIEMLIKQKYKNM